MSKDLFHGISTLSLFKFLQVWANRALKRSSASNLDMVHAQSLPEYVTGVLSLLGNERWKESNWAVLSPGQTDSQVDASKKVAKRIRKS